MRRYVVTPGGGADGLRIETVAPLQPGRGQVLVAMQAASLNHAQIGSGGRAADWWARHRHRGRGQRPRHARLIDRVFGFDEAAAAFAYLQSAAHFGKVVIRIAN
ncbi:NADPH:quinone reductase-like Zn-dependent oxidoreductase [Sphingobium xenophagum]|uniref:NADPH:quinone reductase-like Zn-dependent oxidoreductase n=1 Tax=Sphingobium xenophagum TaxID=121428 RepID=A0ABU1WYK2_SPHXE|nr:zinc-binding dehydrogenase [Sphingobium xenophagum]MDR7154042.1 NADPH:quinone reductase-like Zn-dependent oxidoreductase [Sphingobium xenophagum]